MEDILDDDYWFNVTDLEHGTEFPVDLTIAEMMTVANLISQSGEAKKNKYLKSALEKLVYTIVAEDD